MSTVARFPALVDAGLLLVLYTAAVLVVQLPVFVAHPQVIGAAIAFDLVVTATVVHYMVGIRAGLPRWTVPVVAMGGAAVASRLAPTAASPSGLAVLIGAVELGVALFALGRIRIVRRVYRADRAAGADGWDALETGLSQALDSSGLASAAVGEMRLVTLGITGPFRRRALGGYGVHGSRDWAVLIGVIAFLSVPELVLLHVLLEHWAPEFVAWIVTVTSVYGLLWLWGDAQAMRLVPTRLSRDTLRLRVGLRWRADIETAAIQGAERVSQTEPGALDLCVKGAPNVALSFYESVEVRGLFGRRQKGRRILLQLEDPDAFIETLDSEARASTPLA